MKTKDLSPSLVIALVFSLFAAGKREPLWSQAAILLCRQSAMSHAQIAPVLAGAIFTENEMKGVQVFAVISRFVWIIGVALLIWWLFHLVTRPQKPQNDKSIVLVGLLAFLYIVFDRLVG